MKFYRITPSVGFYDDYNILVTVMSSLAIATQLHITGRVPYGAGDYMTIEGLHLDLHFRLPLVGVIAAAYAGLKPDVIELTEAPGRLPPSSSVHRTAGMKSLFDSIFQPFVLNYFERHRDALEAKFTSDRSKWPDPWQLGWVVRNCGAHGNTVHFAKSTQKAVSWRGLTVSPAIQGTPLLGNLMNSADLLMLMVDMETTLVGPVPWASKSALDS